MVLKNTLGAIVAPLLIALAPTIELLAKGFARLYNSIAPVTYALMGQNKYIKVNIDAVQKYKNELKDAVLGFDELNSLSNISTDYSDMFSEEELSSSLQFLSDAIKALKQIGEFLGLNGDAMVLALTTLATMWVTENTGIGNYISSLIGARRQTGYLTDSMYRKNNALQNQTRATNLETVAVGAMAIALLGATGKVNSFETALNGVRTLGFENAMGNISTAISGLETELDGVIEKIDEVFNKINGTESTSNFKLAQEYIYSKGMLEGDRARWGQDGQFAKILNTLTDAEKSALHGWYQSNIPILNELGGIAGYKKFWDKEQLNAAWQEYLASMPVDNPNTIFIDESKTGTSEQPNITVEYKPVTTIGKGIDFIGAIVDGIESIFKGASNGSSDLSLSSSIWSGLSSMFMFTPLFAADGAYDIPSGQLFIANEAGAELVGTVGGKTSVANNQEITGIAEAVYNTSATEQDLLEEQNALLRQILSKSNIVQIDGRTLLSSTRKAQYSSGVQVNMGGAY